MSGSIEPLILDLVAFVAARPRPCAEAIEAWRSSCPRLTVWEDAVERGLIAVEHGADGSVRVGATERREGADPRGAGASAHLHFERYQRGISSG